VVAGNAALSNWPSPEAAEIAFASIARGFVVLKKISGGTDTYTTTFYFGQTLPIQERPRNGSQ
jgi:hypothetical protein